MPPGPFHLLLNGGLWRTVAGALFFIVLLNLPPVWAKAQGQRDCAKHKTISVAAVESLGDAISYDDARQAAIRQALIQAVRQVSGIDVATSFRSVGTTTTRSIGIDAKRKMTTQSAGHVSEWHVVKEVVKGNGERTKHLQIVLSATICQGLSRDVEQIVAFAPVALPENIAVPGLRQIMSASFPLSDQFNITLESPKEAYYDILVSGRVITANVEVVDNRQKIRTLQRFLPDDGVAEIPARVRRVTVRVMAKATRFTGGPTLVETVERTESIAPQADPVPVQAKLIREALAASVTALYNELLTVNGRKQPDEVSSIKARIIPDS